MIKPWLAGVVQSKGQAGLLVNAEHIFSELLQQMQETEHNNLLSNAWWKPDISAM